MTLSNHQKESGYELLARFLKEALEARADSIRLEYEDTGLGINFFRGQFGNLVEIIPRDREQEVIDVLIERAGMATKPKGQIRLEFNGREHVIVVTEFQSFGETAYLLRFRKPQ
jgi:hypothetical protein